MLRLGPSARIVSWVDIYMLSALAKVTEIRPSPTRRDCVVCEEALDHLALRDPEIGPCPKQSCTLYSIL